MMPISDRASNDADAGWTLIDAVVGLVILAAGVLLVTALLLPQIARVDRVARALDAAAEARVELIDEYVGRAYSRF